MWCPYHFGCCGSFLTKISGLKQFHRVWFLMTFINQWSCVCAGAHSSFQCDWSCLWDVLFGYHLSRGCILFLWFWYVDCGLCCTQSTTYPCYSVNLSPYDIGVMKYRSKLYFLSSWTVKQQHMAEWSTLAIQCLSLHYTKPTLTFFFLFLAVFWARCSIRDMCYIKCSIIVIITTPN